MNPAALGIACLALAQLAQPTVDPPSSFLPDRDSVAAPQAELSPPASSTSVPFDPRPSTFSAEPAYSTEPVAEVPESAATRQAGVNLPLQPGGRDATSSRASELAAFCAAKIEELPEADRAGARALTLHDLFPSKTPGSRRDAVEKYWDLAVATGGYRFALREERFLSELMTEHRGYDRALLAAEAAAARARRQHARLVVLDAQQKLGEIVPTTSPDELPWPVDTPLVGPYLTRFESLFGGQVRPLRLQQIDRALPMLLRQIELRSDAVDAAESAVSTVSREARGQLAARQILDAHLRLRQQRRAFLSSVRAYNLRIAEYAMAVAGPATAADALVATLIKSDSRNPLVPVHSNGADSRVVNARDTIPATSSEREDTFSTGRFTDSSAARRSPTGARVGDTPGRSISRDPPFRR